MSSTIPCLIQLNGDNVAANLLPIMALKPERIVQIVTKSQRAERAVAQFKEVFTLLAKEKGYEGYKPRIQDHTVSSGSMPDVRDNIARLLLENPGSVVNFSGGSKLMSVGAYQAALALGRPSLFCDVEEQRFVDGQTGHLPSPPAYDTLAKQFSMSLLMALSGRKLDEWKASTPNDSLRTFGLRAYELRLQHWNAMESFNQSLRTALPNLGDKPLPQAVTQSEAARLYLSAASSAGLVRQGNDGWRIATGQNHAAHLLTDGWLELAVLDRILVNPSYREVMWNPSREGSDTGRGIFLIDSRSMKLRYFECLPTLRNSPQDHVEAVAQRARELGGSSAEAVLVVLRPAQGQENTIRHAARRIGAEVVLGAEEVTKRFARG
ncbi:MAG: hypothetical protein JNJ83_12445 [Verrucomicrobiaceae bacterium]|nr:hypothetical protein [Verrucomicrobiaceae bacterium]